MAAALLLGWLAVALVMAIAAALERYELERLADFEARIDVERYSGTVRLLAAAADVDELRVSVRDFTDGQGRYVYTERDVDPGVVAFTIEEL